MTEKTLPCSDPRCRQFDFWIGEWDLTWGEDGKGSNTITATYNGCVINEQFDGKPGLDFTGMSVSTWDQRDQKWKQAWVDDQGGYFDLVGEFKDGEMILLHEQPQGEGQIWNRMHFLNIQQDSLDWHWERSEDGGETWKLNWNIHYQRKK